MQQLERFVKDGTWLVYADRVSEGAAAADASSSSTGRASSRGPACFTSLKEYQEYVQEHYVVSGAAGARLQACAGRAAAVAPPSTSCSCPAYGMSPPPAHALSRQASDALSSCMPQLASLPDAPSLLDVFDGRFGEHLKDAASDAVMFPAAGSKHSGAGANGLPDGGSNPAMQAFEGVSTRGFRCWE